MRKTTLIVLVSVMLTLPAVYSHAQGKVTADPNAGTFVSARAADDGEIKEDPRVAQKVTYEAMRKPVRDILSELSEKTGVALKAGLTDADWQVRDRKMNVFAKDIPLASLMNSITRVMKFKWRIGEKNGVTTYRLYMDRKTLLDAENRRQLEEERFKEMQAKGRKQVLEQFSKLENLSDKDLQKLRADNPFLYILTTNGVAPAFGKFFKECPTAIDALAQGQQLALKGSDVSPAALSALIDAMRGINNLINTIGDAHSSVQNFPANLLSNADKVEIHLNRNLEQNTQRDDFERMIYLGDISMGYISEDERLAPDRLEMPFFNPSSDLTRMLGELLIKVIEEKQDPRDVEKEMEAKLPQLLAAEMKRNDFGEASIDHPDDPSLSKKVKMEPASDPRLEEVLKLLAKASEMSIVSDCFGRAYGRTSYFYDAANLKDTLDKMTFTYNYNWDKHGSVLEFRDRMWFKKRALQVPDAWLEKWRQSLKKNGTLEIDELAEMAVLTKPQIEMNITEDDTLGYMRTNLAGTLASSRGMLLLYGSLDNNQQVEIFSEEGLDLRSLPDDQWALVENIIKPTGLELLIDPDSPLRMTGKRTEHKGEPDAAGKLKHKSTTYNFDIGKIMHQAFITPHYITDSEFRKMQDEMNKDMKKAQEKEKPKPDSTNQPAAK